MIDTPNKDITIVTAANKTRNISNNEELNKSDFKTSKQFIRAASETKLLPIVARPTCRTRANSVGSDTIIENNFIETDNSESIRTLVNLKKQTSILSSKTSVSQETKETMMPVVTLSQILPNVKEINEADLGNPIIEQSNKSESVSEDPLNSSSKNTSEEASETDLNVKVPERSPTVKAVEMNTPVVDKSVVINSSNASKDDPTDTITLSSVQNVSKTNPLISTEDTIKELKLQSENSINNSLKEEDEHLSDKENQPANIIDGAQNKEDTISNALLRSPKQIVMSSLSTNKLMKENNDEPGNLENMQKLELTGTESVSETPFNDNIAQNASVIEINKDSSLDGNIQIMKCPDNISDSNTERSVSLDDKRKEAIQETILANETISEDKVAEILSTPEIEKSINANKESEEVSINQTVIESDRCDMNSDIGESNISESVKDANTINNSKTLPCIDSHETSSSKSVNVCINKESISSIASTDKTIIPDLEDEKIPSNTSIHESEIQGSSDRAMPEDFESTNEKRDKVTKNNESSIITDSSIESTKVPEKEKVAQIISIQDNSSTSMKVSIPSTTSCNEVMKENEIPETSKKHKEKVDIDDNSDSNINTNSIQDIQVDEWEENNSDENSLYSMLTEKLGDESENECDFLADKEASQGAENMKNEKEKESFDYDSDDTIVLKTQRNTLKAQNIEKVDISDTLKTKNSRQSIQQEGIEKKENVINDSEDGSQKLEKHVKTNTEGIENTQNVCIQKPGAEELPRESDLQNNTLIENKNSKTVNTLKNRVSLCKPVKKMESEIEESSDCENIENIQSMNILHGSLLCDSSSSNKSDKSIDSDIEREYNLHGDEPSKFSDDDVPGDECRASETEFSDPNDNGSDLADFVVNDDDISEEEGEKSESNEGSYDNQNTEDEKTDQYEQYKKIQNPKRIERKVMKKRQQKASGGNIESIRNKSVETSIMKKGKSKKCMNLDLSRVMESVQKNKKQLEIVTSNKKMKKDLVKNNGDKMIKEKAMRNRKRSKIQTGDFNNIEELKKGVKHRSEEVSDNILKKLKKRKLLTYREQELPSLSMLDLTFKKNKLDSVEDITPLSLYGSTTNFYVDSFQILKKSKNTSEVTLFGEETFLRNSPQRLANYLMYLSKQRASGKNESW